MHNKKYILPFLFFLLTLIIGCDNLEKPIYSEKYQLSITDTLKVQIKAKDLVPIDKKLNKIIFISKISPDTIFIVNTRGQIINKFSVKGESPDKIGSVVSNVGFYDDTTIVVAGSRGYLFYLVNGKLVKKMGEKNLYGSLLYYRIRQTNMLGNPNLISIFRFNMNYEEMMNTYNTKRFYESNKFLTTYDMKKDITNLGIGYNPESIFRQYKYDYAVNSVPYFDVYKDKIYFMINPDTKIYVYKTVDLEKLVRIIDIKPDNFKLDYLPNFRSKKIDDGKYYALNSELRSLDIVSDTIYVSYSTALPKDKYNEMPTSEQLPDYWIKHNKNFLSLHVNSEKITSDILLPMKSTKVSLVESNDYILLSTNQNISEQPNHTIFYVCKLEKK